MAASRHIASSSRLKALPRNDKSGAIHEASGICWAAWCEFQCGQGIVVSVINPAQVKPYGVSRQMRSNTDKIDALWMAQFAKVGKPEPRTAAAPHEQVLRSGGLRLEALQNILTPERNRLQVDNPAVQPQIQYNMHWLHAESMVVSVLGLAPRQHKPSASVKGTPRMAKVGHAFAQKALHMPAMAVFYKTAWGKRFRERLAHAGKLPSLIIDAMMRKLGRVVVGVRKSNKPFNSALHCA